MKIFTTCNFHRNQWHDIPRFMEINQSFKKLLFGDTYVHMSFITTRVAFLTSTGFFSNVSKKYWDFVPMNYTESEAVII
jgi:CTP:phosphocholine cytidylyltransferase-like protein